MTLQAEIANCGSTSVGDLQAVYARHKVDSEFLDHALEATGNPHAEGAATWLIKCHLEHGIVPGAEQQIRILELLQEPRDWQVHLHVLQCLPFLQIPQSLSQAMFDTLQKLIGDRNKFVRAWAYNGLLVLGRQHNKFLEPAMNQLESALAHEAPSVRARIRNALK